MEMEKTCYMCAGNSLKVRNVQALAAELGGSAEIPRRYVRSEVKDDVVARDCDEVIPIIDMKRLLDPEFSKEESARLHQACQHLGFFQLVNHGVPDEVIEKTKEDVAEFFSLPLEIKEEVAQLPGSLEGYGQAFVLSDEQKLEWADMIFVVTRPLSNRNFKLWPTKPASFRETMDRFSSELEKVVSYLLNITAKNLEVDPKIIHEIFEERPQGIRMSYYPPCSQPDEVLGIAPHSDVGALTVLLQANDVPGLQIKKNEIWLPVNPLPGAFIVNVGDFLEILSNGEYVSAEHRAMINSKKERISIAAFHGPREDSMVRPLPEIVKDGEVKYGTMSYGDYLKLFFSGQLAGKRILESMKIKK